MSKLLTYYNIWFPHRFGYMNGCRKDAYSSYVFPHTYLFITLFKKKNITKGFVIWGTSHFKTWIRGSITLKKNSNLKVYLIKKISTTKTKFLQNETQEYTITTMVLVVNQSITSKWCQDVVLDHPHPHIIKTCFGYKTIKTCWFD
jgi:hypothetical protein